MLSLIFGVSIFGVVISVSAFMAGLGLGSFHFSERSQRANNPLRVYAIIELLVALLTFCLPTLFHFNQAGFNALAVNMSVNAWLTLQLCFSFLILFIPAYLMGAGFVFVLRAVKAQHEQVSLFYGINALGAAAGALLPLLFIPVIGWLNTLYFVASIGIAIAVVCFVLSRENPTTIAIQSPSAPASSSSDLQPLILYTYAGIGLLAMVLQVAWTRLFGMLMLRTEYVAAMIICLFILGISLGSLFSNKIKQSIFLQLIPVLIGSYTLLGLWILPHINSYFAELNFSWMATLGIKAAALFLITFPVTMALGAWFPLLTAKYQDNERGATLLYAVNSLGASVGAALTGFVMLPFVGANASVVIAGLLFIIIGGSFAPSRYLWGVLAACVLFAIPVYQLSPVSSLLPHLYNQSHDLYVSEDAISLTHVVEQSDGQRVLLSDLQRMDASSEPSSVESQKNQVRLPLLLHPQPKRILLLGLGTGISASAALILPNRDVTAVEISKGAIAAAKNYFSQVNDAVCEKINIVNDDARHYLMSGDSKFDVIIGDLFHPDLVGRSALLSLQQFSRVKDRLNVDGVFVQWLALNQFDVSSLEIMLRTFKREFANAHMFFDGFRVALVGLKRDPGLPLATLFNHQDWSPDQVAAFTGGEGMWTWLGRYAFPISESDGVLQDEWRPQIEYRLPQARYNGDINLVVILEYLQKKRLHVDAARQILGVANENAREFENAYIANALSYQSWIAQLKGNDSEAIKLLQLSYRANNMDRWISFALADRIFSQLALASIDEKRKGLEAVLKVRSDHVQALEALYEIDLATGNRVQAERYLGQIRRLSPFEKIR